MLTLPLLFEFDYGTVREFLFRDIIWQAALRTLMISAEAQVLGISLGVFAAVSRSLKIPVASQVASLYVWFFRGTPLLLQLFFWFFAFPQLVPQDFGWGPFQYEHDWFLFSSFQAALIGLAINEGAYMAEIVRAGIDSIESGQMDAAKALGMMRLQAMRLIILPQAARTIVPPTGNEFIAMLKNSSLAGVIAYNELLYVTRGVYARTTQVQEMLVVASIWYLLFTTIFSVLQGEIEARLRPEEQRRGIFASIKRIGIPDRMFAGATDERR